MIDRIGRKEEGREFEIKINCPDDMEPSMAFNNMCDMASRAGHGDFEKVRRRFYKMLLRPADMPFEKFVEQKAAANNVNSPIFCLRVTGGYLFFGRYEL